MKGKGKVNGRTRTQSHFRLDEYLSGKASLTSANILVRTHLIALATEEVRVNRLI